MNSTMMQQPSNTSTTSPTQIKTKRRRRAPPSGASEPCHTCRQNGRVCDRRRPYCTQCIETKGTCSGYRTQLTWGVGVASRGKLRGLSLPVPLSEEERAKKNSAMAAEKKEEKKKLKAAGNSTGAGISKHSASASISSLASVRSMSSQDLATLTNMTSGIPYNSSAESVVPQYQYPQMTSLNTGNHPPQFQKLMQAAHHAQGGLSLLLSPMDDMHTQHVEYHGDGTSTPEIYSPLYSPVDGGYLHSPVDIIHISQNRSHPPTSVPDHVSDFFEEESSVGQSSPSIHGQQEEASNETNEDGAISALLYDEEMLNNMYHYSRPTTAHGNAQFANGNTSPSTGYNSSPANSPSPPSLVHSNSFPNNHYTSSYSPNSAARPQQLSRLHTAPHPHLQLGSPTSYPPTPSTMSPSTPTTPIYGHCLQTPPPTSMPPTSAAGNPSSLTSPAVLLQQQLLQNQNAIMQQQQRQRLMHHQQQAGDQQFYLSHLG
ncbi:hypothetical protein H072_5803 [Dactylellina haptotyla CBS 200.50]|uniref:Zn(2)-C6 fungal-type domain-containing protein n=1 Tax=Dactylellina haptotyla (strain CBS 200.50) TaxID=1284197 RepID=S8ABN6_DACHA|nr:hypothetical protein H072_5803 [Dactylellina haptotyla CBS 200.50]